MVAKPESKKVKFDKSDKLSKTMPRSITQPMSGRLEANRCAVTVFITIQAQCFHFKLGMFGSACNRKGATTYFLRMYGMHLLENLEHNAGVVHMEKTALFFMKQNFWTVQLQKQIVLL